MSHFAEIKVAYSQKCEKDLVSALETVFGKGHVEIHPEGTGLFGYSGDDRSKSLKTSSNYAPPCHVVIRRNYVGGASNDVGFCRTEDGKYAAYISDYDKGSNFNQTKQDKVSQFYAESVSTRELKNKGYMVVRKVMEDGKIKLVATKWS